MNVRDVVRSQQELAQAAARRFVQRGSKRQEAHERIDREGILKAAGVAAAVGRAAHMAPVEGGALMRRRADENPERTFEALLGLDDSDPVNFMGRGQIAARAVCRVLSGRQAIGTGFLVAPNLLLTNNHVIASIDDARESTAEFDYELDVDDRPRSPVERFALRPDRLFVTSDARTALDFTLVAVEQRSESGAVLEDFGYVPLDPRIDKILIGEPAIVIQHPRGEPKRVCLFSAELVDKLEDYLHYMTDTDHGSSGSCVMNRSFQLVALHHAATTSGQRRRGHEVTVNEGIRVSSILRALETGERVQGDFEQAFDVLTRPNVVRDGRPQRLGTDGGRPPLGGEHLAETPAERRRVAERTRLAAPRADHFSNRVAEHFGYRPDFLDIELPLPEPNAFLDDLATADDGGRELRYTHYSVLFSRSRCLPLLTAVNIDGAQSRSLRRNDRAFEAADKWYLDPRIDAELQLKPAIYDRTDFDFGHMVRREDPIWGDENTARMANDDTFFITNAAPQHNKLNTKTWLELENAVLNGAREERIKVSVFTGPVLAHDDPEVLGVQIPTAFWKIVAWVEDGRLRASGFMQWQTKLVAGIRVRPESMSTLEDVEEYQVPVREIAQATSLDFGPLVRADVLRGRRRRIQEAIETALPGQPSRTARHKKTNGGTAAAPRHASAIAPLSGDLATVLSMMQELHSVLSRYLSPPQPPPGAPRGADERLS